MFKTKQKIKELEEEILFLKKHLIALQTNVLQLNEIVKIEIKPKEKGDKK